MADAARLDDKKQSKKRHNKKLKRDRDSGNDDATQPSKTLKLKVAATKLPMCACSTSCARSWQVVTGPQSSRCAAGVLPAAGNHKAGISCVSTPIGAGVVEEEGQESEEGRTRGR